MTQDLPHISGTPARRETNTYTRFAGRQFEAFEYSDWMDESMSWKTSCYIGNWSPLRKSLIEGPGALSFLSGLAVNSFARFDIGQAKHVVMCTSAGKVAAEGVLMRLGEQQFLLTSGPSVLWTGQLLSESQCKATSKDVTDEQFIFQVQGPSAIDVLERVTHTNLRDIGFMRHRSVAIEGVPVEFLRQGMSGEIGFELHGPMAEGERIYAAILQAGRDFGMRQLGGRTKMVNHVEACFPTPSVDYIPAYIRESNMQQVASSFAQPATAGSFELNDVSELFRSPVELGWAKNIKLDHEFIGRAALEPEVAQPRRVMVTLVWNDEDVVDVFASLFRKGEPFQYMELPRNLLGCMYADQVLRDGRLVGVTTSRCYSYFFRQMISLCVIDAELREPGTEVGVLWGEPGRAQKLIRATVAPAPYKRDNRRVDLTNVRNSAS